VLRSVTDGTVASRRDEAVSEAGKLLTAIEPRASPGSRSTSAARGTGSAGRRSAARNVDASNEVPFDRGLHAIAVSADGFENATRVRALREGAHDRCISISA
jgi:hypothetical protein